MRPRSTFISLALAGLALVPVALARDIPSTLRSPLANQGVCSGFYREDFNGGGLLQADQWNGDPNSANWLDEFGAGAYISNGYLEMDLRRPPGLARGKESAVTWSRCVSLDVVEARKSRGVCRLLGDDSGQAFRRDNGSNYFVPYSNHLTAFFFPVDLSMRFDFTLFNDLDTFSLRWWHYGEICASMRIARGGGVVSALFLASYVPGHDIDDEIDWEWGLFASKRGVG